MCKTEHFLMSFFLLKKKKTEAVGISVKVSACVRVCVPDAWESLLCRELDPSETLSCRSTVGV